MGKRKGKLEFDEILCIVIGVLFLGEAVAAFLMENWLTGFTAILAIALTWLPYLFAEKKKIALPSAFYIVTLLFIFAAIYLGEFHDYYEKIWWWDIMLHGMSSLTIGFIGFIFVFLSNRHSKMTLTPFFIAFFAFCFALACGALWEIYEFGMDQLFGMNMQKWQGAFNAGLIDTMEDIIVDTCGALISAIVGYIYLKKGNAQKFANEIFEEQQETPEDEKQNQPEK